MNYGISEYGQTFLDNPHIWVPVPVDHFICGLKCCTTTTITICMCNIITIQNRQVINFGHDQYCNFFVATLPPKKARKYV